MAGAISALPSPAAEGAQVTVSISGANGPATITVNIDNGGSGETDAVDVTVDAAGNGSAVWRVPAGWAAEGVANFDAPGLSGASIIIE